MEFLKKLFKSQTPPAEAPPAPPEKPADMQDLARRNEETIRKLESLDMAPTLQKLGYQKEEIAEITKHLDDMGPVLKEQDRKLAELEEYFKNLQLKFDELEKSYAALNKSDPSYENECQKLMKIADSLQPELKRLTGSESSIWDRLIKFGKI